MRAESGQERKAGFATTAEIAKERVRRVGAKFKAELLSQKADLGFRVFKLDQSNFITWDARIKHGPEVVERQLELHIEHIREDRTDEDVLYELLLKSWTSALTVPVERQTLAGKTVYSVAERKPERAVCLDEGFSGNDQLKANAVQIFKTKGVTSFKTV